MVVVAVVPVAVVVVDAALAATLDHGNLCD